MSEGLKVNRIARRTFGNSMKRGFESISNSASEINVGFVNAQLKIVFSNDPLVPLMSNGVEQSLPVDTR